MNIIGTEKKVEHLQAVPYLAREIVVYVSLQNFR